MLMVKVNLLDKMNRCIDSYFLEYLKDFRYKKLTQMCYVFLHELTIEKLNEYLEVEGKYLLKKFMRTKGRIMIEVVDLATRSYLATSYIKEF